MYPSRWGWGSSEEAHWPGKDVTQGQDQLSAGPTVRLLS